MADSVKSIGAGLAPIGAVPPTPAGAGRAEKAGPSFKDALGQLTKTGNAAATQAPQPLKFSNHAVERMQRRGINYSQEQMGRIERAIDKAAAKGSRETLLLTEDSAMIVSVNNRTVVTVMDKEALRENVFTNIDSTVMI